MPKPTKGVSRLLLTLLSLILLVGVMLAVYSGSIPEKYDLEPGDASTIDIFAPRSIRDKTETDLRAAQAAAEVPDVMLRSEQIATKVKADAALFFSIILEVREKSQSSSPGQGIWPSEPGESPESPATKPALPTLAETADLVALKINQQMGLVVSQSDALSYASFEDDRFNSIQGHVITLTNLIMAETVDSAKLKNVLAQKIENLEMSLTYNKEDSGIIERTLGLVLKPNVVFDSVATENARQAVYNRIQNNPVMIERGSRIVSMGDIITDETYALLADLSLIDDGGFDFGYFSGIALLLVLLLSVSVFYIRHYERQNIYTISDYFALVLSVMIPILASVYLAREAPLSPPVYFAAVLITVYYGLRTAIVLSFAVAAAILPMTGFNPIFLLVAMGGCLVAALFTRGIIRKDNYAFIIIMTAGANILLTFSFGLIQKESWTDMSINCGIAALSGALSVIAAIGVMPVFEMLFNTVSPFRLIELSQPGHPLLRRLFVEAPGSSQHSMMVANLADAAAVAIGANALLARVGSYYHDVGKLENPLMFTENQEGENPHDFMSPEKSAEMILDHPDAGVRVGRRYRLPAQILRIIHEHHGTTSQAYFYHKALKDAEQGLRDQPDPNDFKYRCPIPTSRESAIVMLADSVEAAMKSTGTNRLEDAEKLIRKIIKTKSEQDQLIGSRLSYYDVEQIIQAFLQVYSGHFHERVRYPDDHPVRESAE
ncbi:MAG: HD family phosphohydrolase [Saccharofermentanales bacterium]|nr:HDIG domain-containing protein [Clostridiaceae bacterium]